MPGTPLGILDLVPVPSGSTAADALRNSIDLARHAERLGYTRYWFAEHHLNPGVAGTSPAILLALTAAATATIRLGSGAVQLGHRTALSTVEEFGLIDALYPGRLDLGLGRSGAPRRGTVSPGASGGAAGEGRASGVGPGGVAVEEGRGWRRRCGWRVGGVVAGRVRLQGREVVGQALGGEGEDRGGEAAREQVAAFGG
ncbi:LLM class flavin-dependent oxidoreductase, partial [Streptomyces acidiscabies]|uniref:LLM class flavin-dependent oxidoreductase n=3 Tax=Streptomyces acidiscabies TaxID=42234 RepID=UPI001F1C415D